MTWARLPCLRGVRHEAPMRPHWRHTGATPSPWRARAAGYIARINHHEGMYAKLSAALAAAGHPRPVGSSSGTAATQTGLAGGPPPPTPQSAAAQRPAAPPPGWCAESLRVGSLLALDMEKAGIHLPEPHRTRMQVSVRPPGELQLAAPPRGRRAPLYGLPPAPVWAPRRGQSPATRRVRCLGGRPAKGDGGAPSCQALVCALLGVTSAGSRFWQAGDKCVCCVCCVCCACCAAGAHDGQQPLRGGLQPRPGELSALQSLRGATGRSQPPLRRPCLTCQDKPCRLLPCGGKLTATRARAAGPQAPGQRARAGRHRGAQRGQRGQRPSQRIGRANAPRGAQPPAAALLLLLCASDSGASQRLHLFGPLGGATAHLTGGRHALAAWRQPAKVCVRAFTRVAGVARGVPQPQQQPGAAGGHVRRAARAGAAGGRAQLQPLQGAGR